MSAAEQKNPLLQLKQPAAGTAAGRLKRRYKRKNGVSPVKKGTSPLKRRQATNSPAKHAPPIKPLEPVNVPKVILRVVTDGEITLFIGNPFSLPLLFSSFRLK